MELPSRTSPIIHLLFSIPWFLFYYCLSRRTVHHSRLECHQCRTRADEKAVACIHCPRLWCTSCFKDYLSQVVAKPDAPFECAGCRAPIPPRILKQYMPAIVKVDGAK
ncbi:hypothetical protein LEN26_019042 [Aphanomyces euteiches]|nr:hypothetical protein LEN26_019042 [Aphanomyces euteiches]KAH9116345.1 hypothetical protein AeMF1_009707 [Aphanomyces euteiches]KAH9192682.1 hypothetical protein AeNC1_005335 [Aphanomyces euteiches]